MPRSPWVECSFLIPLKRDQNLSDGQLHDQEAWGWLEFELFQRFGGWTSSADSYSGVYTDPDTGRMVSDKSLKFFVALPRRKVPSLRKLLREACGVFQQKAVYLSVAGHVE